MDQMDCAKVKMFTSSLTLSSYKHTTATQHNYNGPIHFTMLFHLEPLIDTKF